MNDDVMTCPFCDALGFDRIGLKLHLTRGWCQAFVTVKSRPCNEPGCPYLGQQRPTGCSCYFARSQEKP